MVDASFNTANSPCDLVTKLFFSSKHWLRWLGNLSMNGHERTWYCYDCFMLLVIPSRWWQEHETLVGRRRSKVYQKWSHWLNSGTPWRMIDSPPIKGLKGASNDQSWGMGVWVKVCVSLRQISLMMVAGVYRCNIHYSLAMLPDPRFVWMSPPHIASWKIMGHHPWS